VHIKTCEERLPPDLVYSRGELCDADDGDARCEGGDDGIRLIVSDREDLSDRPGEPD
jgi:hypothetical protein